MAGGFAINSNEPIYAAPQEEAVRDFEWFKRELAQVGVSPLHIHWDAQEHFQAVAAHLLESYVAYRRNWLHREALAKATQDYQAALK